ncbi:uncharacterized protein PAC_08747 [Phialocephala subalpina]|uniref:Tat pathway signal sequence domain protein n=1 Tax=Phialocephala subalpina TaxID=576137 RepID=A0A1L7X1E6_9HELO|nr:uncharacterized protein PAC_08747 [Phialocephala subalpina]
MPGTLRWLEGTPIHEFGTTFGIPWLQGQHQPLKTRFNCFGKEDVEVPIQSWVTAYWPDGTVKWTGHAIFSTGTPDENYEVRATTSVDSDHSSDDRADGRAQNSKVAEISVSEDPAQNVITVNTGKIVACFSTRGNFPIRCITSVNGKVTGRNGRLVLLSQPAPSDEPTEVSRKRENFEGRVEEAIVEQCGPIRAVVALKGRHHSTDEGGHKPWLPFTLRLYLYAGSACIRMMHTIIYDGDMETDFIRGIGVRFDIPLQADPLYNRHIRISGVDGGVLSEAVQGVTGLRRDPGLSVRQAQTFGKPTPPIEEWDTTVSSRLHWVPSWNDYSLTQLSPDGFNVRKRAKAGCSWVNIPGGTRSDGLVYLGGATGGGLAVGLRDFWERCPTGVDIRDAASDQGALTIWLYSPCAPALDLRQYHDGLGQDTYDQQLDALNITYEDWEPSLGTPYGIAKTSELYLMSLDETPDQKTFSELSQFIRRPPVLLLDSETIHQTKAFGDTWCPQYRIIPSPVTKSIQEHLAFLFDFHKSQISQRRWYGFWDHGDIMHAYDEDRHTWRYDIGGYAWDNSELSPDLWLWLYFLQTGRADVYRMAEALTRHTGEVDVYHLGPYKGLGTRHGVQHWSDSCKQARISNALYRKYFYYLSGGDERVGELLQEVLDTEQAILTLDPYRKVRKDKATYQPDATALSISLGTDWSALAAAWLIEFERRGPRWEEAKKKLLASIKGIGNLTNGFVTGTASYNLATGEISPPAQDPDNKGVVQISHLSAMFGLFEVCAEIVDTFYREVTGGFERAWLEYCVYFNGTNREQIERFGVGFGKLQLRQGHSRLTAYAAHRLRDHVLAKRAWEQFHLKGGYGPEDGYGPDTNWKSRAVSTENAMVPVTEATWVSTNISSLYGIGAIQNLALIGDYYEEHRESGSGKAALDTKGVVEEV